MALKNFIVIAMLLAVSASYTHASTDGAEAIRPFADVDNTKKPMKPTAPTFPTKKAAAPKRALLGVEAIRPFASVDNTKKPEKPTAPTFPTKKAAAPKL